MDQYLLCHPYATHKHRQTHFEGHDKLKSEALHFMQYLNFLIFVHDCGVIDLREFRHSEVLVLNFSV